MPHNHRTITQHFYTATSPECQRETKAFKPAVAFEVLNDIQGIAGYWQFPQGLSATAYERKIMTSRFQGQRYYAPPTMDNFAMRRLCDPTEKQMSLLQQRWKQLVSLNPDLKIAAPRMDDPLALHDAMSGVAALFNVADIQLFLETRQNQKRWDTGRQHWNNPVHAELLKEIHQRGGDPRWLAAPETLRTIIQKMDERQRSPLRLKRCPEDLLSLNIPCAVHVRGSSGDKWRGTPVPLPQNRSE